MQPSADPVFPPELEQEIFEITAIRNRTLIPTLLLVCKRVHEWLEPLLYRVVVTTSTPHPPLSAIKSKPLDFLQKSLHHILIDYDIIHPAKEFIFDLLSQCSMIESISISGNLYADLLPTLLPFPTTKIEFVVWRPSKSSEMNEWARATLVHPILALYLLEPAVEVCTSLQVIITGFWGITDPTEAQSFTSKLSLADPRIVIMVVPEYIEDWVVGAWGGDDFWRRAEAFIAGKAQGGNPESECAPHTQKEPKNCNALARLICIVTLGLPTPNLSRLAEEARGGGWSPGSRSCVDNPFVENLPVL
ncbi:hypothetical protein R3P38DRAFT_2844127 [Favolaschia claudopus]|uniref:F-box domain-containing protein n=1 Tax=Favolaschia claudopus TaxID=2862362 RepID=A0AAW0E3P8_9AGAR